MARFTSIIIGGLEIAAGVVLDLFTGVAGNFLIAAGVGQVIGGIGTLLGQPQGGISTASRNPIQPWNVVYGRAKVGGTIVYINEHGDSDKYLDLIFVLASHPCLSVDALLFDNQRVLIDPVTNCSKTPVTENISIFGISRSNGVVTVVMSSASVNGLQDGDQVQIKNVSGQVTNDKSLNGKFYISVIGTTSFTYLCGGFDVSLSSTGQVQPIFPHYREKVYMEALTGNHTSTFAGMLYGTPYDGDTGNLVTVGDNPWTSEHLLFGRTCVFLRLHYNDEVFASGLPQISFRLHGKNDIFDPRGTPGSPATPVVIVNGAQGSTSCSYVVVARTVGGTQIGAASSAGSTSIGDSVLSRHNFNAVAWAQTPGAISYDLYRTVGYVTGKIATTYNTWWNDTGFVGDGTTPPGTSGSGTGGSGYTENSALCIADYLSNQTFGFKAQYGTEIPLANLITAANICDEQVALASGLTEPRYTCNGQFQLSSKRGEVLQNLLTSCGGKITYSGSQFVIHPAAWVGPSFQFGQIVPANGSGSPVTAATVTVKASFAQGSSSIGAPQIHAVFGVVNITQIDSSTDTVAISLSGISTTPASFSYTLSSGELVNLTQMSIVSFIEGTLYSGGYESPISTLNVYDIALAVTYADSTTDTFRPTQYSTVTGEAGGIFTTGVNGEVVNPGNAIDSDVTTFASITRDAYNGLGNAGYLRTYNFPFASSAPANTGGAINPALSIAAGPFVWRQKVAIRDLYNGVKGTFISPANGWQNSDFPAYAQDLLHGYSADANLAADGGDRRWKEIQLPFTVSPSTAQRLAKIELLRSRQQGNGTFLCNMTLYQLAALDVIQMTLPFLGWTNKLLEVSAHRLTQDRQQVGSVEATVLSCELDLQETDPGVYEWTPTEELTPYGFQRSGLFDSTSTVSTPTGVTAVSGIGVAAVGSNGVTTSQIAVSVTPPADGYVLNGGVIQTQYQVSGASTWTSLPDTTPVYTTSGAITTPSPANVYIGGLTDGTNYYVRVRSVSASGVPSDWVTAGPITASGSSFIPHRIDNETPTGTVNGTNTSFTLSQIPNPALSLNLYRNGELQAVTLDFTLSGGTVTFTVAPQTNDWLRANYWY